MTPLDFFKEKVMPEKSIEQIRPLLARYGCSGSQQTQVMNQLSAGQKARIVFSLICHEKVSRRDRFSSHVVLCLPPNHTCVSHPILALRSLLVCPLLTLFHSLTLSFVSRRDCL